MDKSVYIRMSEQDAGHWWFVARRQILRDQIAALGLPARARILEAGCGPGGNLAMLAGFGNVEAFELDDEARRIAAARSGIDVRPGMLPDRIDEAPGAFDLIAAFDVIEHVDQDAASVQALARLLRPGGRLIVTVPAYRWLWSAHDERHHHKRRYTRSSVRSLAVGAGLEVEKCSHFNSFLLPVVACLRLVRKILSLRESPDDTMPRPVANRILTRIFGAERYLLRHVSFPAGVSILCVARRP